MSEVRYGISPRFRYLCAYVYYCSLLLSDGRALFVHIPEFDEAATPGVLTEILCSVVVSVAKRLRTE